MTTVNDSVPVHRVARRRRIVAAEPVGPEGRLSLAVGTDVNASAMSAPVARQWAQPRKGARRRRRRCRLRRRGRRNARGGHRARRWSGGRRDARRRNGVGAGKRRKCGVPSRRGHDRAGHGRDRVALPPAASRTCVCEEARSPQHEQHGDGGGGRRPGCPPPRPRRPGPRTDFAPTRRGRPGRPRSRVVRRLVWRQSGRQRPG